MQDSDTTDQRDQEILALLKDYPMADATAGFFDQALVRAMHEGTRRQRNRWVMTGVGGALAAGVVLWMLGGFFLTAPDVGNIDAGIPDIVMTIEEPRTVNLVFASAEALDAATLTVMLPAGLELAGFPGQREITWQTSLNAGKNLLPLKLVATSAMSGDVFATLKHKDRGRTFTLRVKVS